MTRAAFWLGFLLTALLVPADLAQAQMVRTEDVRAAYPEPAASDHALSYEYLADLRGVTICYNGKSLSYLNLTANMGAVEEAEVRAHEAMHRTQHERAGGCRKFDAIYRTPRGRLESEAEAFRAGACAAIAMGANPESLERQYVQIIYSRYMGGGTPVFEVLEAYRRYGCP